MCVRPLHAFIEDGSRPRLHPEGDVTIPCGVCHECLTLRSSDWGLRTQHELGDHDMNCCVTLTYNDDSLPSIFDRKRSFQLFLKRLRRRFKKKISYLVSHEFGSTNGRLHHHAILFGVGFPDMVFHKTTPKGTKLFTSRVLDSLWSDPKTGSLGWCNIGEATAKAGFYIASYALKKCTTVAYDNFGEEFVFCDTMDCSKRPAIGLNYLRRNHRDLVLRGEHLPRYYIKKMKEFYSMPDSKFWSLSFDDQELLSEMSESLAIYEANLDFPPRSAEEILNKYKNFRKKFLLESDFRKHSFSRADNSLYRRFCTEYKDYIAASEAV
jgi:hypothetical protein